MLPSPLTAAGHGVTEVSIALKHSLSQMRNFLACLNTDRYLKALFGLHEYMRAYSIYDGRLKPIKAIEKRSNVLIFGVKQPCGA